MVHVWVTGPGQSGSTRLYNLTRLLMELDASKKDKPLSAVVVRKRSFEAANKPWNTTGDTLHKLEKSFWHKELYPIDPNGIVVIACRDIRDVSISRTNKLKGDRDWWIDPGPRRIEALLDAAYYHARAYKDSSDTVGETAIHYVYEMHSLQYALLYAQKIGLSVSESEMVRIFQELDHIHKSTNAKVDTRTFFMSNINTNNGVSRHDEYLSKEEQDVFAADPLLKSMFFA